MEFIIGVYEVLNDNLYKANENKLIWSTEQELPTFALDDIADFLESLPNVDYNEEVFNTMKKAINDLINCDPYEEIVSKVDRNDDSGYYHIIFVKADSINYFEKNRK